MLDRSRMRVFVLAAAACFVTAATPAAAAGQTEPPRTGATLRAALDEVMQAPLAPPGLAVLIDRRGTERVFRRGVADVATGARPKPRLHMRLASVSKAFSGAVALALVSDGRLGLDDTVGSRLPGLLPHADAVTLRQLLQHTGGVPEYIASEEFLEVLTADPAQYLPPRELVEFVRDEPLEFAPGTRYEYSDTDNLLVGLMAEQATGVPYEELLRRYVYEPVGIRRTGLPITVEMPQPFLHGYDVVPDEPLEDVSEVLNPALAWASGGMVSTQRDTNRFFRAYVSGELFGGPELRAQRAFGVIGSSSPPGPGRNRAGLALFRYETRCGTVYGHTGSFPGYRQFAAATANGRRSLVFTVNSQLVSDARVGSEATSDLIRHAQEDAVCHLLR